MDAKILKDAGSKQNVCRNTCRTFCRQPNIEYFAGHLEEKFLIMGYTEQRRPLHVVVLYAENKVHLATVYDPRTMPWKWEYGYQVRKCFCKNEEEDV